jgi:hypothetical protein
METSQPGGMERPLRSRAGEDQQSDLLRLEFTLPQGLRVIATSHQEVLIDILHRNAAYFLMKPFADPHFRGAKMGFLAIMCTWTRATSYLPEYASLGDRGRTIKRWDSLACLWIRAPCPG